MAISCQQCLFVRSSGEEKNKKRGALAVRQTYKIIEKFATGGMAEVYRARAVAMKGFEKEVAIKRVLPNLTRNRRFVSMFLDEARLSMLLNHPNIVQVFDVGRSGGTYFLVMEYVPGLDLKSLGELLLAKGRTLPLSLAVFIVGEVMKALAYAHELKNDDGVYVMRVHRDVSPPNVLISRDGHVKLTDFGLAKAAEQILDTDPGVVKGKFSYLSPEAASGLDVDHRADIFSAGIILWEILANRRLFMGATDAETVDLVRACGVPALQPLNPEVDAAFDALLSKALAQDPDNRFATAQEFGETLLQYLFDRGLRVTSFDLAAFIGEIVQEGLNDGDPVLALLKGEVARCVSENESLPTDWDISTLDVDELRLSGGVHLVDDLFEAGEGEGGKPASPTELQGGAPDEALPPSGEPEGEPDAGDQPELEADGRQQAEEPAAEEPAAEEPAAEGTEDEALMDENAFMSVFDDDEAAEVMRLLEEQMEEDGEALSPPSAEETVESPDPEAVESEPDPEVDAEREAAPVEREVENDYYDDEPEVIEFGDVPPPDVVYVSPVLLALLAAMGGMAAVSLAYILIFQLRVFG